MMRLLVPLVALILPLALPAAAADWGDVATPSPGLTQSIGFYSAGCLQGAQPLPLDGPGYEAIRVSRNRYWGQPITLELIKTLSEQARQRGQSHLYIGDIGQPRGGPMPTGHASHQVGLDVDIWFERSSKRPRLALAQREEPLLRSLVRADDTGIDDEVYSAQHAELLRLAAEAPNTDRIFVNRWIKERLCHNTAGNRGWLHKLVPWYGHDEHFHVRLYCPPGNPQCQKQAGYAMDDGCGEALDLWFRSGPSPAPTTPPPETKPYRPKLPAACQQVLKAN
jgi:penicillin-insensitive murein endopeptidase